MPRFARIGAGKTIDVTSPGKDKQPNWPPTPPGPFFIAMRQAKT